MRGAVTTTRWWWLRHAPVKDADGMVYGRTDLAIDPPATARIREIAEALPADAVGRRGHCRIRFFFIFQTAAERRAWRAGPGVRVK